MPSHSARGLYSPVCICIVVIHIQLRTFEFIHKIRVFECSNEFENNMIFTIAVTEAEDSSIVEMLNNLFIAVVYFFSS